jgi:HNH endonuclease/Homeodomain-like domain
MIDTTIISILYADNRLSTRQIAEQLDCSKSQVAKIVKRLGLSRSRSEAEMLRRPPQSKHWRSARAAARRKYQRHFGVKLTSEQHIHHINGDFTDNRIENLMIVNPQEHGHIHHPPNPIPRWLRPARKEYMRNYERKRRKRAS